MKRLQIFATLIVAIALSFTQVSAQSVKFDHVRIVKKSLTVGKAKATKAADCVWLEIGDTSSNRAAILMNPTDSSKIDTPYKRGLIFWSAPDSTMKVFDGRRLRKVTLE